MSISGRRSVTVVASVLLTFISGIGAQGTLPDRPTWDWLDPSPGSDTVAVVGVNLLPMDTDRVLRDQTVVIQDGRIARMGPSDSVRVPASAGRVAGDGRYLLPGLADMHVHLFSADELPFYLRYGITLVRNMWGWDLHREIQGEIEVGSMIGPRIVTSGPIVDGDPPRLRGSSVVTTPAEAWAEVARQARHGFDGIKVYDGIPAVAAEAIYAAASSHGFPVWGHVPESVGLFGALVGGQRSLEHLHGYPAVIMEDSTARWAGPIDPPRLARAVRTTRRFDAWNVPTLVVLERDEMTAAEQEDFLSRPLVSLLPETYRRFCCSQIDDPADDPPDGVRERWRENRRAVVAALAGAGARLLVGSDTGNRFVLPGTSYHEELRLLERAGLSNYEVLRAATRDAAEFLGRLGDLGTVTVGKRADLLLVEGDPRSDLGALRDPVGVFMDGRWLPRRHLESMVAAADSRER